jgi:hypothetical protein
MNRDRVTSTKLGVGPSLDAHQDFETTPSWVTSSRKISDYAEVSEFHLQQAMGELNLSPYSTATHWQPAIQWGLPRIEF